MLLPVLLVLLVLLLIESKYRLKIISTRSNIAWDSADFCSAGISVLVEWLVVERVVVLPLGWNVSIDDGDGADGMAGIAAIAGNIGSIPAVGLEAVTGTVALALAVAKAVASGGPWSSHCFISIWIWAIQVTTFCVGKKSFCCQVRRIRSMYCKLFKESICFKVESRSWT